MNLQYLVFEGIYGCGKHEQIKLLSAHLIGQGVTTIQLLEPSYGPHGREIRRRLKVGDMGTLAEQRDLFTGDRREHVDSKVVPLLKLARSRPGFLILQSRTYISAAAYQSDTDDNDSLLAIIAEQEAFAPAPDHILVLDLPVDAAIDRLDRVRRRDALEQREILCRAQQIYRRLAMIHSKCILIDAQGSPGEVASRVRHAVQLD
jgi:dTMP kinase